MVIGNEPIRHYGFFLFGTGVSQTLCCLSAICNSLLRVSINSSGCRSIQELRYSKCLNTRYSILIIIRKAYMERADMIIKVGILERGY